MEEFVFSCKYCKNWEEGTLSCKAFDRIPLVFLQGDQNRVHDTVEFNQKGDFIYEPKEGTPKRKVK